MPRPVYLLPDGLPRPLLRGWLHLGAFVVAVALGVVLVVVAPRRAVPATVVYVAAVAALFGVSALYHRGRWRPKARAVLKRADHSMISVLIAGTYTPVCVLVLHGTFSTVLLVVVWVGALGAAALQLMPRSTPRAAEVALYLVLGWVAILAMPQIAARLGWTATGLIAAGGVLYTLGALVYARKRPDPAPAVFGYHELFHAFTIAAAALHFAVVAFWVLPASAQAFGPVGTDPPGNYTRGALPSSCGSAPQGTSCINAAVCYLDRARASLGQGPYALPADFVSLSPPQQAFVLANLDRAQYGLPAVPGLTDELDQDAGAGVQGDMDPRPSDPDVHGATANWASGEVNLPLAYLHWMYDDGPGSNNRDCTASDSSGCWGHRHDVLWSFDDETTAMGAATGVDAAGNPGDAMLIAGGDPSKYQPVYSYTWTQATSDGAGTNAYNPGLPQVPMRVKVSVFGPGTVTDSSGHRCSSICTLNETQGVPVAFTERPGARARFLGWGVVCTGTGACSFTPDDGTQLAAAFKGPAPKPVKIVSLTARDRRVSFRISAPAGSRLRCSLTANGPVHYSACTSRGRSSPVRPGRWTFRVRIGTHVVKRTVMVH